MRVKSYTQAVRLANSAGLDAAKRRMRKAGRKAMTAADFDHAAMVTTTLLADLGFDVEGWITLAGLPRNEPDEPTRRRVRRKRRPEPVQLELAFA